MTLEDFLPWFAGAVAIPVVEFLKTQLKLSGKPALALAIGVSLAGGVLSVLLFEPFDFSDWGMWLASFGKAFTSATIIYKMFVA